jgi:hypothetical protein
MTESSSDVSDPDIVMGAFFLSHLRISCEHCGVLDTPQWRKGWY